MRMLSAVPKLSLLLAMDCTRCGTMLIWHDDRLYCRECKVFVPDDVDQTIDEQEDDEDIKQ